MQSNKDMESNALPSSPLKLEQLSSSLSPTDTTEYNRSRTWSQPELYLIAAFLHYNSHKFHSESSKKQSKIFKFMSAFIQTRNINQCRSYTNKLLKSFGTIDAINQYFKQSLPCYSQVVAYLRDRNIQTFQKETLMQSYDSIQLYHTIDKIIAQQPSPIIIPQVIKRTHVQHPCQPHYWHQPGIDIGSLMQWAIGLNPFQFAQRIM